MLTFVIVVYRIRSIGIAVNFTDIKTQHLERNSEQHPSHQWSADVWQVAGRKLNARQERLNDVRSRLTGSVTLIAGVDQTSSGLNNVPGRPVVQFAHVRMPYERHEVLACHPASKVQALNRFCMSLSVSP
jgi:hypothetical protein